jgi:hypothetical protein
MILPCLPQKKSSSEEELLAYDNLNFDNRNWEGSSSTEEERGRIPELIY